MPYPGFQECCCWTWGWGLRCRALMPTGGAGCICHPATCITHCKGPSPDGKICLVPATCRNLAIRKSIHNTCRPSQFQRTGRER